MSKLTPFDLATDVSVVEIPEAEYSSLNQSRFNTISPKMGTTWNATQTFDSKGQPKDKDNDKD